MRPTLKDVARHSGVSLISASRVLREAPNISKGLRERVRASAAELGYAPNRIAGSLRGRSTDLIAVIVPSMSNSVFANIVDGIDEALTGTPHRSILGLSQYSLDREEEILRDLLSWAPAGVIISGLEHSDTTRRMLRALDCPVIEVMDSDGEPIDTSVGISHDGAARLMADHLVERGYRRIGYVGAWGERPIRSRKRRAAFEARLADLGAPLVDRQIEDAPSSFSVGAAGCRTLRRRSPQIDAIFFANDDLALGAAFDCAAGSVSVPGDLALAGFNGLEMRDGIVPRLTTIRTPRREIGLQAGRIMRCRLSSQDGCASGRIELGVTLLAGDTT